MFSQQSKKNIKEYRSGMKAAKTDRYEEGWAAVRKKRHVRTARKNVFLL